MKDVNGLNSEMKYAVVTMRQKKHGVFADMRQPMLYIKGDSHPVCTWSTIFAMLGEGVVVHHDETNTYELTPDWANVEP